MYTELPYPFTFIRRTDGYGHANQEKIVHSRSQDLQLHCIVWGILTGHMHTTPTFSSRCFGTEATKPAFNASQISTLIRALARMTNDMSATKDSHPIHTAPSWRTHTHTSSSRVLDLSLLHWHSYLLIFPQTALTDRLPVCLPGH